MPQAQILEHRLGISGYWLGIAKRVNHMQREVMENVKLCIAHSGCMHGYFSLRCALMLTQARHTMSWYVMHEMMVPKRLI